jgi:HSP20 family protein
MTFFRFSPERDPLNALLRLQREFDRSSENPQGFDMGLSGRGVFPPVNVLQDAEGSYVVRFEVPGVSPEDINIESQGRTLTLSGKREASTSPNGSFHRRERGAGQFSRSFQFPTDLDLGQAQASHKQGMLTIRIPKREDAKPRQITVQAA